MTVYSNTISRSGVFSGNSEDARRSQSRKVGIANDVGRGSIYRLNISLLILLVCMIVGSIFVSNIVVSQKYKLSARKLELNQLNALLADTVSGIEEPGLKELLSFAQKSGLIEAKEIDYILESDGFAVTLKELHN